MAGATDPVDRSARLATLEIAPLGPYLLFLGDTVEQGYAKTAFGLCDWAPDRCIGELALPGATVSTGIPRLSCREAYAKGARALLIGVATPGGSIPQHWISPLLDALKAGLDIVSGMHARLTDIPQLAASAEMLGRRSTDHEGQRHQQRAGGQPAHQWVALEGSPCRATGGPQGATGGPPRGLEAPSL